MSYYSQPMRQTFRFYPGEIRDLLLSILVLTLAFTFYITRFPFIIPNGYYFLYALIISFIAIVFSFFLHEMAHKYVALRYGYPAAFKRWDLGLLLALVISFFGVIFAAPGAVYVYGFPTLRENGKISAAGPIANIVVGFSLLTFKFIYTPLSFIFVYIAALNFFISFFNLLPIGPMDGTKIIRWNLIFYILLILLSLAGLVLSYI